MVRKTKMVRDGEHASRPVVILLHGFLQLPLSMAPLAHALRAAEFRTVSLFYPSWRVPLTVIAKRLRPRITEICASSSAPVHFVGHSMGGLIIRALLAQQRPANLGKVVMLGTPNQGSEVADLLHARPLTRAVLGQAAPALVTRRGENLVTLLGAIDYPLGVIAGNRTLLPGPLSRILPRPHDGKVSVAATHVAGEAAHITLPVSHTGMLLSAAVHRQVIHFLANGRFSG